MADWVAVLADKERLIRIAPLRDGESGVVNLTTMLPTQDRAYIEIFLVRGSLREPFHTFYAQKISRGDPRPRIVVSAHVRGEVTVTLRVNGELVASHSAPIRPATRAPRSATAFLLVPLLLLAAALAFGTWWLLTGNARPAAAVRPPAAPPPATTAQRPQLETEPREPVTPTPAEALRIRATVHFLPESAQLLPEAVDELETVADRIAGWLEDGGSAEALRIRVEGHTAMYGTEAARIELSLARAQRVADHLRAALETAAPDTRIETAGFGAQRQVTASWADEWRNRRAQVTVTGDAAADETG